MSILADYYKAQIGELNARKNADIEGADAASRASAANRSNQGLLAGAQAQEAQARAAAANAGASLTNQQAGQLGANDASLRASQGAETGLKQAQTNLLPQTTAANNRLTNAQALGQQITDYGLARDTGYPGPGGGGLVGSGGLPNLGGGLGLVQPDIQGYETGGRVLSKHEAAIGKAKKPGPTDTVPTMLTPGEAVLNKGAVSHYGTDIIDHMNKMGLMKMGAESELAKAVGAKDPHAPPKSRKPASKGKQKAAA